MAIVSEVMVDGNFVDNTEKTTPIDADITIINDSADSNKQKKLSWSNIKATLKTYFDTLYTIFVKNDGTVNPNNLLSGGDFECWSAGPSSAPDGFTSGGVGNAVARESSIVKLGTYSCKITSADAQAYLYQTVHLAKGINYWKGRSITFSCWIYATAANKVRINLWDGLNDNYSSYHTGDSTWQLLTCSISAIYASATYIYAYIYVEAGSNIGYMDGAICVEGESLFAFSDKPAGEGVWADYFSTSTKVGWVTPTGTIYTKKIGKIVFVEFILTGVSNVPTLTFTLPYTKTAFASTSYSPVKVEDNSVALTACGLLALPGSSNIVTVYRDLVGSGWTASGNKSVWGQFWFEANA